MSRRQTLFILSILFAAAPFGAALIRALGLHHNLQFLWLALASLLGATLVMVFGKARGMNPVGGLSVLSLAVATLFAGATAFLTGAEAPVAVLLVAFVFGLCWAASFALYALSRTQ